METEKKKREETKKCLKPLLQNWRTDDCTDENRSEKYILFCFPRIVVPKQAQHSLCVHLRRLVIEPGLKNLAVRPNYSLGHAHLVPTEKTNCNISQTRIWSFSILLVAINEWTRAGTAITSCWSFLHTCQTCVELILFNDNVLFLLI